MKKVFIKYNPYKIETTITVDGKILADNSKIGEKCAPGTRLQEWIEEMPQLLIEEYNDNDFEITFHGTLLDYDDLAEVFTKAYEENMLTAKLERKAAKETTDKIALIDKVFKKIQKGPFDELRAKDIINSFNNEKSEDFEVDVVGTMSAGKSTFINSILQSKLMPASSEAKTAIITKIKDNDEPNWQAEVKDKDDNTIAEFANVTYEEMDKLNSNENVAEIKITGDIPFVTSEENSLVLVDTPGPNNARNNKHRDVQNNFLKESSKNLVIYIMEATYGNNDDDALLKEISKSMTVKGKCSKDRFIFIVNKMDARRETDGGIEGTLNRIRDYLKGKHIYNPNLFPIAALPALDIRMIETGIETDDIVIAETNAKAMKLNRDLHLEEYATLPLSVKREIKEQLAEAENLKNINEQALIHTGIVSVEAAIRQYVQKYAKTNKIATIVDTFMKKLDDNQSFEKLKNEIVSNQGKAEQAVKQIEIIRNKVDNVKEAQNFRDAVDKAVMKVNNEARDVSDKIVGEFQAKITKRIDNLRGENLDKDDAQDELKNLERFAQRLEPSFQDELDRLLRKNLVTTSETLLNNYLKKLSSLKDECNNNKVTGISIDPLSLMKGTVVSAADVSLREYTCSKEVKDGEEWVKNTDKKWYKPWTWFQESGYYRTKYKTVTYIDAGKMAEEFLQPIQDVIFENGDNAVNYALEQSKKISESFKNEFERLDGLLKNKLDELKSYATDKDKAEERIKETEHKLKWLEEIKSEVESILEI